MENLVNVTKPLTSIYEKLNINANVYSNVLNNEYAEKIRNATIASPVVKSVLAASDEIITPEKLVASPSIAGMNTGEKIKNVDK